MKRKDVRHRRLGKCMEFQQVWFATDERLHSRSKMIAFDDVGRLSVDANRLDFSGSKLTFTVLDVSQPTLVSATWNSIAYLYAYVAFAVLMVPIYLLYATVGQARLFWWSIVLSLPIVAGLQILLVHRLKRWMRVTGTGPDGTISAFYFFDGRAMGWAGMLGGTSRLVDSVDSCLTSASS
ncbi:hypothetical protein EG835_04230 [bacterium]|nr:hypothetical protein [bacterium]